MSYGRRKIYTNATSITIENVADEVRAAALTHAANRTEIQTLYDYYTGKTKIQNKAKEIRPEINHKVYENRANEIVNFHKGYVFGEPIQYVRRERSNALESDNAIAEEINTLNAYMADANKASCDDSLAEWMYVAGVAYRLILPNEKWVEGGDESPFKIRTLDPRNTFVVYYNNIDEDVAMTVCYVERDKSEKLYSVYTENSYFEFTEYSEVIEKPHMLSMNPIIEYPANNPRLGVFEIVVPLIDSLDELQSNRMDDIVQFVNSFLAILGGQLDKDTYEKLNDWKMLCLPEGTDAKYLSTTLSQSDVQTLKDDFYQAILTICGVPNRNGGTSTSDTGQAVQLRDGWSASETRAKATETIFKKSEREALRLILRILRDTEGTLLRLSDIDSHFTRRNYENVATKSQVLISMLNNNKIHPELAFQACGLFVDPESAYLQSMAWFDEQEKKEEERIANARPDTLPSV